MLKLIAFLFTGCWHRWEHVETKRLTGDGGAIGQRVVSKCARCGLHKKQDLI